MATKFVRKIIDEMKNPNNPCIWHINERRLYYYDSEERKLKHKTKMEEQGWKDEGTRMANLGTVLNPDYVWCGWYRREKIRERKNIK